MAGPRTELMDLQELARQTGAIANDEGVWHMPFYLRGGQLLMLPVEEWIRQRKVAGGWHIGIGVTLPCGCVGHCHGHPSQPAPDQRYHKRRAEDRDTPEPDGDALTPRDEKTRESLRKPSPLVDMFTEAEEGVDTRPPSTEDKLREAYIAPLRAMGTEQDNWAHRSDTMRCRTCMFYVVKHPFDGSESFSFGRCRNGAPTLKGWPAIYSTDWCGAHKLDAEKI